MLKLCLLLLTFYLLEQTNAIRIPGENVDKNTLTSLGIKTLDWQGGDTSNDPSQISIHHNYSKVLVQNEGVTNSLASTQNKFSTSNDQSLINNFGQASIDDYDDLQLVRQSEEINQGFPSQTTTQTQHYSQSQTFGGQQQGNLHQSFDQQQSSTTHSHYQTNQNYNNKFGSQTFQGQEEEYNELSSTNSKQTYNAHSYGDTRQIQQIIEAENALKNQQQFEDFPDYDQLAESSNIVQQERQVKKYYTLDKPIYVHGFKYPPDSVDVYPSNKPTQEPSLEVHSKCPKSATGQFVYSLSCNQFLNCWNGRGYVQNCAPGTLFNPETLECDFAAKVKCVTGPRKPQYELTENTASLKLETGCPAGFSGVIPHHTDCSKFINCGNGVENVMDCPPGTLFSLKINNCDFPYKAECAEWSSQFGSIKNIDDYRLHYGKYASGGSNSNYGTNENYQTKSNFNTNGQNHYHSGSSGHDQKYTSSNNFRQHETSGNVNQNIYQNGWNQESAQNKYQGQSQQNLNYESSFGENQNAHGTTWNTGSHQTSSQGYNINQNIHQDIDKSFSGDYSQYQQNLQNNYQQAGQSLTNQHGFDQTDLSGNFGQYGLSTGSAFQQGSSGQNQNVYNQNQYVDSSNYINGQTKPQIIKCPKGEIGLLPHPHDCSKFLNCANGQQASIENCGPGTVFNPGLKVCDFPYNVNCQNTKPINNAAQYDGTHSQYQQSTGGNSQNYYTGHNWQNGKNTEGQTSHYGESTGQVYPNSHTSQTETVKCPAHASGLYPHPTICSKFLNCGSGQTFIQDCGPGTVFNPVSKVCDFPYNVDCGASHGEGLIDVRTVPVTPPTPQTPKTVYITHPSRYGQNNNQGQNQQGAYGGNSYEKNNAGSGGHQAQDGYHGQGQSTHDLSAGNAHKPQFSGFGSTNTNQQDFYTQNINKHSSGHYNQNNEDQNVEESRNYNQQSHGFNQNQNNNAQRKPGETKFPPPYPSTDLNADYEFGNENSSPSTVNIKPVLIKPKPNNSRKRKDFCEAQDFHCSVDDCIPQTMVCDGVKDCPNGIDEQNCEKYLQQFTATLNSILAVREKERFLNITLMYCAKSCLESKGFQCKSFSYRKDDGACLLSDTNVGHSGALVKSHPYNYYEVKDLTVDCTNLYKCPNQKCIKHKQICDGVNDCGDRIDEKGCTADAIGYEIKLGGTDKKHEGRIEIKAFGKWGYICDDKFGLRDADVACRELGFPLGALEVKANSYYAQDVPDKDVFYLMDDVTCLGNETTLRDCDFNGWGVHNCESQEVAGIVCKTPQEVCSKDYWKCDTVQECLPLAFVCDGVYDCTDQSDEGSQHCEAPIQMRLAGGSSKSEGRIEIQYHGIWGTVCDDDFNDDAAKVVCKHLGFPGKATAKKDGHFGPGDGPIWLDQVFCQGNESALQHCVHWNWGEHNCEHTEDVGVICSNVYDGGLDVVVSERHVQINQRKQINDVLPEYLFPERCGLRKDDQFIEEDNVHFRVVKGSTAKQGDYPWQASLRIKYKAKPASHWCGAVVISQKFVLTAAHCLEGFSKGAYLIVAGDYNTDDQEGTEQEAYIDEFYIHEGFRKGQKMNNDIAIVKLKGDGFTFTKDVQPICLPETDASYESGMNCTISGFGTSQSGVSTYSHQLRAGWIPMQSKDVCKMPHVYGAAITDGMICAGSLDEGIDACDGDSGGPLACLHEGYFTLYGLTSWGQHCGHANKPGVYVKVSYYRKWIDDVIKKHC